MEFVPPKLYYFLIGKAYSIDNCEMANVLTYLPIDKHKLYSCTNIETLRAVEPDQ